MEYFIIEHDRRLDAIGGAISFPERMLKGFEHAAEQEIVYIKPGRKLEYSCIVERPVLLISEEIRTIVSQFEPQTAYKAVVVMDQEHHGQLHYSMMDLKEVHCISEEYSLIEKGQIKKMVIDESRIGDLSIFKIPYYHSSILVARLDVAECLLRKSLYGLRLRRILSMEGEGRDGSK